VECARDALSQGVPCDTLMPSCLFLCAGLVLQGLGGCASSMRQPLGKYLRFFLLQTFGLPSLRDSNLRGVMQCVKKNEEVSSRLRLFGVLCGILHPQLYVPWRGEGVIGGAKLATVVGVLHPGTRIGCAILCFTCTGRSFPTSAPPPFATPRTVVVLDVFSSHLLCHRLLVCCHVLTTHACPLLRQRERMLDHFEGCICHAGPSVSKHTLGVLN